MELLNSDTILCLSFQREDNCLCSSSMSWCAREDGKAERERERLVIVSTGAGRNISVRCAVQLARTDTVHCVH